MENVLINAAYRIDFDGLQRATGKDGNFALASAAVEPPTGGKDYAPLHGPVNYILAGMTGFEWSSFAAVALGYFRINATDGTGSKKGNNGLAGLGAAYTPVDEPGRMLSFQLGLAAEIHARDVLDGTAVEASGGWELFASPTLVWAASKPIRFFLYVSLPISQDYRSSTQEDRWRAGVGIIYSFESSHAALLSHAGH